MILPTPTLILNSRPLDSVLAFHDNSQNLSIYPATQHVTSSNLLLLTPSKQTLEFLIDARKITGQNDAELFKAAFPNLHALSTSTDPVFRPSLYSTLEALRTKEPGGGAFNATEFLDDTALLQVADPGLPGPEYDAPYDDVVRLRPKNEDQGFLWENMYSTYKDRRYRVCGMNQKPWPPR
jgi:hypothetical protein